MIKMHYQKVSWFLQMKIFIFEEFVRDCVIIIDIM